MRVDRIMKYKYSNIALIVGASSGVGKVCAKHLHDSGYKVYGTSRYATFVNNDGIDKIAMIPMDVTHEDSVKEAVEYVIKREGVIGVLINCPGYGLAGAIEDTYIEEAKKVFDTNFFGIMSVCNAVLPYMRNQKNGLIINISSVAGLITLPYQSMYCASKYALESLTECYRMETADTGIKLSLIEPGGMKTNFKREYIEKYDQSTYKEKSEHAINKMIADEIKGPGPEIVIKELKSILNRVNPPIRKIVGVEYKLIGILRKMLPARITEIIISKMYGGG